MITMRSLTCFFVVFACFVVGSDLRADNSTAQGVALIQASRCRMGHCGGNRGMEGVGMGMTAQQAIQNCCYYGRYVAREIGVAQGRDGRWYACVRY